MTQTDTKSKIGMLNEIIHTSEHTVFLSGPAISAQCGIADFRSLRGVTLQETKKARKYDAEYLLSRECLLKEPEAFFTYYCRRVDVRSAEPGETHRKLAQLEKAGLLEGIITLNVDGLHQKAGSVNVKEICGTALECSCDSCHTTYSSDLIYAGRGQIPQCPVCHRMLRPMITLYGELLPEQAMEGALEMIDRADCLIVGGCRLTAGPAQVLASRFKGNNLVIINAQKTKMDQKAKLVFHAGADRIMRLVEV